MAPAGKRAGVALDPAQLRAKALRLLARRERSRAELRTALGRHCDDAGALEALLDELQARGWLSEQRLAEQVVHARRGRASAARIRQELRDRGLDPDLVEQATSGLDDGDLAVALALWRRRFGRPASDPAERSRQLRYLLNRGFGHALALKVLRLARAGAESGRD